MYKATKYGGYVTSKEYKENVIRMVGYMVNSGIETDEYYQVLLDEYKFKVEDEEKSKLHDEYGYKLGIYVLDYNNQEYLRGIQGVQGEDGYLGCYIDDRSGCVVPVLDESKVEIQVSNEVRVKIITGTGKLSCISEDGGNVILSKNVTRKNKEMVEKLLNVGVRKYKAYNIGDYMVIIPNEKLEFIGQDPTLNMYSGYEDLVRYLIKNKGK